MQEPDGDESEIARQALLKDVAAYAASHGLSDASLIVQFGSYLRHSETKRVLMVAREKANRAS
jgi:hypothetical protein